jgi:poly-gamma-glutamate synthesis protein (capsule biosynthesis protein)
MRVNQRLVGALLAIGIGVGVAVWWAVDRDQPRPRRQPAEVRGTGDTLTIAAAGDSLTIRQWPDASRDPGFAAVVRTLSDASLALTNLEENLLEGSAPGDRSAEAPRWPHGSRPMADALRGIGFTVISCANNHAIDYGAGGMTETLAILNGAGLRAVGCGPDLPRARAAVVIGQRPRAVALMAVTTSAAAESRATAARGDINARPGVSALRYTADITADPATFARLKEALTGMPGLGTIGATELTVGDATIKQGPRTVVNLVADSGDERDILDEVKRARSIADVVVVSLHSHEPSNQDEAPAEFVQTFARKAIDSGADLVIGHGPHQIRGIERYGRGVIYYSLGNFMFDDTQIDPQAMDVYESGMDLYSVALGGILSGDARPIPVRDEPIWWEGIIPVATFERGTLTLLQVHPVDLGGDMPGETRGVPRPPAPGRATGILNRLARLSAAFGTGLRTADGIGVIELRKARAENGAGRVTPSTR